MHDDTVHGEDTVKKPEAGESARPLWEIVGDLWGNEEASASSGSISHYPHAVSPSGAASPAAGAQSASASAQKNVQPVFPPFEQLWKVADETVDWTEVLVREHPSDGLTSDNLWQFFRSYAKQVLVGDVDAYLAVLKTANPLGDLRPYARHFSINAESAERLSCIFQVQPAYLAASPKEAQRYLCGVSLRAARDLMALLPVSEVAMEARQETDILLTAVYPREALQKVRFGFTDPVAFTRACGGNGKGLDA